MLTDIENAASCRTAAAFQTARVRLGRFLLDEGYRFTTVTPATHARVNARPGARRATCLRDIFGWSRPFEPALLPAGVLAMLEAAGVLREEDGLMRSTVRFSTLGDNIFMHSAWPTTGADTVFFGPDTYRFASLIQRAVSRVEAGRIERIVDLGCGSGAGGLVAGQSLRAAAPEVLLTDINLVALDHARVNAGIAGMQRVRFLHGDLYAPVDGPVDLIVANPPYLLDPHERLYRHGGGASGGGLSLRIVLEGLTRLRPGGMLVLYTGSAVIDGRDTFLSDITPHLQRAGVHYDYAEIDPDVFGEELELPAYQQVDRIAAVGLVIRLAS
ncbi:MAG: class I SAM-dependent methyltransferase [Comamonadaceae bacterium]|nr:MAG: class I SAM-dependent methyltransferase [Comamonadaceae bacterium]